MNHLPTIQPTAEELYAESRRRAEAVSNLIDKLQRMGVFTFLQPTQWEGVVRDGVLVELKPIYTTDQERIQEAVRMLVEEMVQR